MGPLEGGTLVTIEGSNLGLREEDVRDNVFIGDVPCRVHEYHVSVRITCVTGPAPLRHGSPDAADLQFPVRVTTPAGTTQSTVKFTYTVRAFFFATLLFFVLVVSPADFIAKEWPLSLLTLRPLSSDRT